MRSARRFIRMPRCEELIFLHLPVANLAGAARTARSTSGASASATRQISSPVEGLIVGKVLPETLSTHSLLMSSFVALTLTVGSTAVIAVAMRTSLKMFAPAVWCASFPPGAESAIDFAQDEQGGGGRGR